MWKGSLKYIRSILLISSALLCFNRSAFTQSGDSIQVYRIPVNELNNKISFQPEIISHTSTWKHNGKNDVPFLDSIKLKASRYKVTSRLYNMVVVTPDTAGTRRAVRGISEEAYLQFTGKRIRKIEIKSLRVFGQSLEDPSAPKKFGSLLNKTHINTNENIIRKNLLFSPGDTVSPITLSDNERILRDLSFIDDARINLVPVSDEEVDVIVLTKDIYSLGGSYKPNGLKAGSVSIFENNLFGIGHEIGLSMPYNSTFSDSPGFGMHYLIDNIGKTFTNLNLIFSDGLGEKTYGFDLSRRLVSATTKYAGGISVRQMYKSVDLDTLTTPEPLKYNLQDYWLSRSFLINREKVSRLILGLRYTNNNVFERPFILPDSFHSLQRYKFFLGSLALSVQKYYKANLIYGYGRTEDIPYGGLIKVTFGKEVNEFKTRNYAGSEVAYGKSNKRFGYVYTAAGLASYLNMEQTEQGVVYLKLKYFSNLTPVGRFMVRNFVNVDYTRGFDRNSDESLTYIRENGLAGFRNDSVQGGQRLTLNIESVIFSPVNLYGFRFAFFGFADFSSLAGTNQIVANGTTLSGIGLGVRIRNDNLIFNTFQIRFGFYPDPPLYSRISNITFSGEQLLKPSDFESGPPSVIPYR